MRVLLVEDDDDVALLLALALEQAGHQVTTARTGADGVRVAAAGDAEVIVLDGMLPDLDGLEVLRLLAGEEDVPKVPVVMASARVGRGDQLAALAGGATAYVVKPFEPETIARVVDEVGRLDPAGRAEIRRAAIEAMSGTPPRSADRRPPPGDAGAAPDPNLTGTLSQVLNLAFDAIVSVDEDHRIVGFNRGAEAIFGYLSEEVVGKPLDMLLPERLVAVHRQHVADFVEGGDAARIMGEQRNVRGRRRDGREFPAEASITKLMIDGRPVLTAIVRDATERRRTETELRTRALQQAAVAALGQRAMNAAVIDDLLADAAGMLAEVLDVDLVKVCTLQPDGQLLLAAGIGWRSGAVGRHLEPAERGTASAFLVESDAPIVLDDLATDTRFRALDLLADHGAVSGVSVALHGRARPLGTIGVYTTAPRSFTSDDIHVLQAFANVVATAIQRQKDEGRIRAFLDAAPDATLVVDGDGRVVSANAQAEVLFGYGRAELLRLGVDALVPDAVRSAHASHRSRYAAERRSRAMGEGLELTARRKDGSEVPVDIMLRPLDTEEGPLVVAAVRDITERRRNEAVRDAFLHAVSHELRTPLTSVIGFSSLLVDQFGDQLPADALDLASRIRASAGRLGRLLVDLLDLDRLARGVLEAQRRPVQMANAIHHAVDAVTFGEREVAVDVDPPDLVADIDPAQFERIAENLLVNAARHTPAGTRIDVRITPSANGILLVVEDDGPGVPADQREAIFEPFRRNVDGTSTPGTGIGLSLVARFAELHGGRAWVEDRRGGGASFRVVLGT